MSGSFEATAAMSNREPFSMSSLSPVMNPVASQPELDQQMHISYMNSDDDGAFRQVGSSPPPFQPIPAGTTVMSHSTSDQKRKRGRPRKYGPDGNMNVPLGSPQPPINAAMPQHQQQQQK